jgi:hypothetical protein
MMARIAFVTAMSLVASLAALAEAAAFQQIGTLAQRHEAMTACGHDARLFCRSLKEADGPYAYLVCLGLNRGRLTTRCIDLLVHYGQ